MEERDLEDGYADALVALHRVAATPVEGLRRHLTQWLEAGIAALGAEWGLVLEGSGPSGTVLATSGSGLGSVVAGSELVDHRVHQAMRRRATVAVLGSRAPEGGHRRADLGDGAVVVSPLWAAGEVVGALVFVAARDHPPFASWPLALVDVTADLVSRTMERLGQLGPTGPGGPGWLAEGQAAVFELIARKEPVAVALLAVRDLLAGQTPGATAVVLTVRDGRPTMISNDPEDPWVGWFAGRPDGLADPYGQAIATGEPVIVADIRRDPRFGPDVVPDLQFSAVAVHPVRSTRGGETFGLVVLLGSSPSAVHVSARVVGPMVSLAAVALDREADDRRLAHLATHDPLTGVGNRAALIDRLQLVLARARRTRRPVAVLFCDLDGFKAVNDEHGHDRGDQMLIEVAARISRAVRPSDTVSRTGGDEFVVICEDLADPEQAVTIAGRITESVEAMPVRIGELELAMRVSVGVAEADPVLDDADRLLRQADLAMYETKRRRSKGPSG